MSSASIPTMQVMAGPEIFPLDETSLAQAFASFSAAAASLENSYVNLRCEVVRLRHELEDTNRDLERTLEANRRLEQERDALSRRQALAEMSTLLAHEMRNPLGSMELFAGLLAESDLEEEERHWVEHLQAGLRTLAATVNNVLHYHSQPAPALASTDLGQLLHSTCEFLRPLARQAGVCLELRQELDVVLPVDRHRLEQVLLNLALNAFRFMPDGGVLKICGQVESQAGESHPVIEITDTGRGICAEDQAIVFRPGFTTCGSPGLGLTICKTIMGQHGGSIALQSRPGRGTTFRLQFPACETARVAKSEANLGA